MNTDSNREIRIELDKTVDVLTAHFRDITNPLETEASDLFDGSVLFKFDSISGELVQVVIYDFSIIRRKLLFKLIFLYTKQSLTNWLEVLTAGFKAGKASEFGRQRHVYHGA